MSDKKERREMFHRIIAGSKDKGKNRESRSDSSKVSAKSKKTSSSPVSPVISEGSKRSLSPAEADVSKKHSKTPESTSEHSGRISPRFAWEESEDVSGM